MAAPAQHSPEPERLCRIGDVSRLTDTKPFVLRFWETEFPMLQPVKTPKGHRLYRQEDIDLIRAIKRLLYEEGFTIAGARRHLSEIMANGQSLVSLLEGSFTVSAPSAAAEAHDSAAGDPSLPSKGGAFHRPEAPPARARTLAAFEQLRLPATETTDVCRALLTVRDELRAILTLLGTR